MTIDLTLLGVWLIITIAGIVVVIYGLKTTPIKTILAIGTIILIWKFMAEVGGQNLTILSNNAILYGFIVIGIAIFVAALLYQGRNSGTTYNYYGISPGDRSSNTIEGRVHRRELPGPSQMQIPSSREVITWNDRDENE